MPYKINERISDIRIAVRGKNQEQLFIDAFLGIMYMMKPTQKFASEKVEREVSMESIDTSTLLADFLNEALSLATVNNEFYTHILFYRIQPTSLRAKIFGVSIESFHRNINHLSRSEAEVDVKEDGAWEAIIILNV